ncbi:hypothetical protein CTEN210_03602 [Chaetoceros tenuissimus]|uniref:Uncharacterized protein n=1 Tax=Chaetoceros tenuissimus TaxID=426638 RepID=A0AAD3CJ95_9STRA|nr:hypothetical protein CTEN210_03602 [Chaetoceros tenuissimus]
MKNFVDIDSSDDEADLVRWEKRFDGKLPNVKSEELSDDNIQLPPCDRNIEDDKDEYVCMNVKPSRQKRQPRCRDSSLHEKKESASTKKSNTKSSKKTKYAKDTKIAKITWIPFEGTVTYVPKKKSEWHHIIYDDGDEEDMDHSELENYVNSYYKKYPTKSRPMSKKGKKNFAVNTKMIREFPHFTPGKVVSSSIDENSNSRIWYVSFEGDAENEMPVTEEKMKELVLNHRAMVKKMNDEDNVDDSNTSEFQLGENVAKPFIVPYVGEVISIPKGSSNVYRVRYKDDAKGDEDMELEELEDCVREFLASDHLQKDKKRQKVQDRSEDQFSIKLGTELLKEFQEMYPGKIVEIKEKGRYDIDYDGSKDHDIPFSEVKELRRNFEKYFEEQYVATDEREIGHDRHQVMTSSEELPPTETLPNDTRSIAEHACPKRKQQDQCTEQQNELEQIPSKSGRRESMSNLSQCVKKETPPRLKPIDDDVIELSSDEETEDDVPPPKSTRPECENDAAFAVLLNQQLNGSNGDSSMGPHSNLKSTKKSPRKRTMAGDSKFSIDCDRIAVGNKVYVNNVAMRCVSTRKKQHLELILDDETKLDIDATDIEQIQYYAPYQNRSMSSGVRTDARSTNGKERDLCNHFYLILRANPTKGNGLAAFAPKYYHKVLPKSTPNKSRSLAKRYVIIESRNVSDFECLLMLLRRNETLGIFFANDDNRLSYDLLNEEIVSLLTFKESASSKITEEDIAHSIESKHCTKKSRGSDNTNQENNYAVSSDDDVEIITDVKAQRKSQTASKKRKRDFDEDKICSPHTTSSNNKKMDNRIPDTLQKPDSKLERQPVDQSNTTSTIVMEDQDRPPFDKDSFMKTRLFHLNSFLDCYDGVRVNPGFGPFIRASVATPGFYNIPQYMTDMIPRVSYNELREAIAVIYEPKGDLRGAPQVALWLKCASVGDFVMMRHEYSNCPCLPSKLRNRNNNRYIGPVYVLGVITEVVKTNSDEEEYIARNDLGEFRYEDGWTYVTKFCRVDWKLMGFKANLQKSTQTYINRICQSTLNEIAKQGKAWPKLETDWESVRSDLWNNATMEISPADFNEVRYGRYQQPFNPQLAHRGNENENRAVGGNNDIRSFFP